MAPSLSLWMRADSIPTHYIIILVVTAIASGCLPVLLSRKRTRSETAGGYALVARVATARFLEIRSRVGFPETAH